MRYNELRRLRPCLFLLFIFLFLYGPGVVLSEEYNELKPEKKKVEVVIIGGQEFVVPDFWQGNKVEAPELTIPPLVQVPTDITYRKTGLYMLPDACNALLSMTEAAKKEGIDLKIDSAYRSPRYQEKIYLRQLERGKSFAFIARSVAPPGYSEHALGTVVDFVPSNWEFAKTDAYKWLLENAAGFNFYQSYKKNGGKPFWEACHWRYIGGE